MKFLKASMEDLDLLSDIETSSGYKWGVKRDKFRRHLERIARPRNMSFYMVSEQKEDWGYFGISFNKKESHLNYFAVKKKYQGKRIFKKMMAKAIALSKNKSSHIICLSVWAKNFSAIALYTKKK